LPWLLALFIAEFLTSSVMNHYSKETQLAKYLMFLPLILGAGGNSGSQATTMVTRSLAIGEVSFRDFFLVVNKEFFTALLVGGCLGVAGMIRALVWGLDPNLMYAIGCSLPAIVIWATSVGGTLPLAAKRLGIDPAVMSAPFISTFVDATGLVIYFEIVKIFFGGRLPLV
jgi:magnesium transporter